MEKPMEVPRSPEQSHAGMIARASVGYSQLDPLQLGALTTISAIAVMVLSLLIAGVLFLPLGALFVCVALVVFAAIFTLVWRTLRHHGHTRFGGANIVTSARAGMVSVIAGAVVSTEAIASDPVSGWALVCLVVLAFALDGVDGYLARRQGLESDFGARYDMEVDAFLILVLSLAAVLLGKLGYWVLLMGLMRYGFIAAAEVLPALKGQLPPSFRRKLVCVLQIAVLCAILLPIVSPAIAVVMAVPALAALIYSFAVDSLYLLHHAKQADGPR